MDAVEREKYVTSTGIRITVHDSPTRSAGDKMYASTLNNIKDNDECKL
jgi:hypothetical protein